MLVRNGQQEEGMKWIEKCAGEGHEDGLSALADMLRNGGGGLARDPVEAVRLHEILAEKGDLISMNNLGSIYFTGRGPVKRDAVKSAKYYKMYHEKGGKKGRPLLNLGVLYRDGDGIERDLDQAISWFEKDVAEGNLDSHKSLAQIYHFEEYGRRDAEKLLYHYKKAGEAGLGECFNTLGRLYETGEVLAKDDTNAVTYYLRAAEANDPWGLYNLGVLNEFGRLGLKQNPEQAIELYQKAAGLNHEQAKKALARLGRNAAPE
jgi:TPR repeat protein